MAAELFVAYIS